MFKAPATAYMAAYEAGAQLRNVEHLTEWDLCYRNTGNFLYGVHWVVANSKGENLFRKYNCHNVEELEVGLIRGMAKEVEMGNGPIVADFGALTKANEGADGFYHGIEMKKRLALDEFIRQRQNIDLANLKPEVSRILPCQHPFLAHRPRGQDHSQKSLGTRTDDNGRLRTRQAGYMATALVWPPRTGLRTAAAIAKDIDDIELDEIDEAQVEFFHDRIYESYNYTGENTPYDVIRYISRLIKKPEYSFNKTEETMTELIGQLNEIREQYRSIDPRGRGRRTLPLQSH